MQEAVKQYATEVQRTRGVPIHIRVGLNAGEVVVRSIGSDLHMDYSAIGQTTHLAARMEQMAMPGAILITPAVLGLVEGFVQVKALGAIPVRGLRDPVKVYEVTGAGMVRSRLQAATARGLTRFVGRQPELAALQQALAQASAGHGQVVALVGEAGVGKSRLVYEFTHSHHTQGWRVLESASASYGKATPYFPVIDLLRRYSHVDDSDNVRTIRAKITGQVLTLDAALQETVPALLALLDAVPDDSPFLKLDPPQRRQRTLDGLKRVLLRESHVQPLLLVFEDLHWIDAETQALLDSLVESLPTARLLLLVNYRPEYQHSWGSKTYYTQLRLDPLPPASADALLQALLGDDPSLVPLKELLIARTEGNPFFLEESVRTLVETGVLVDEPGAYRLAQALPTIQVPATVQAVLAARIDRLSPEDKRLLQTAAVIGTEVPFALLQAIADMPEADLHRGLAHLQAAEFLYETRLFPEREYTFKHALTHEVAYNSLLLERRRVLHARIVETLEGLAGERVVEQVERLAYHAVRGEVWDKATAYLRQAGAKALGHSAYREAVTSFEQALEALQHLPDNRHTREQAIDLRLDLRLALMPFGAFEQILALLHEADTLATALDDPRRLGGICASMAQYFFYGGDYERAIAAGQRALALAATSSDISTRLTANIYVSWGYYSLGDYRRVIDCCRQNIAFLHGELARERFGLPGFPAALFRTILAWCLADVGAFAEAIAWGEEGVRMAEAVEHPYSLAINYANTGLASLRQGDLPKAIPMLERGLGVCQAAQLPIFFPRLASALGLTYTQSGRLSEGLALLEQAVEQSASMRFVFLHALWLIHLGEGYRRAGRLEEATQQAMHALELSHTHQEQGHQAYALRLLGDIAAHRDPPESALAEAHYQQALDLAEELGMRPLLAHCHHGLGTLYARIGQPEQTRTELAAAIALYRAMGMTFWLPQAEAALAQVEEQ
jgi:tetratricopeptide (TPR) repeat protein